MGKWYAGVVTISIALVLILISMFLTWYSQTEEGVNVGLNPPGLNLTAEQSKFVFDNKSHTMTTEYSVRSAQRTTSIAAYFDTNGDGKGDSSSSKTYAVNERAKPENYQIPMGGSIADGGQPAVLGIYTLIDQIYFFALIIIAVAIALIVLAGLGLIPKFIPKIPLGIVIALTVLAPFYFAFFQPQALDSDAKARYDYQIAQLREQGGDLANVSDYQRPSQAEFFMGTVQSKDTTYQIYDIKTNWGPGLGWFLAIGALVFSIIAIGNTHPTRVRKKKSKPEPAPEAAPQAYQCPQCAQPLLFMKNANAYYCNICQTYVGVPGFPAPTPSTTANTDIGTGPGPAGSGKSESDTEHDSEELDLEW